MLASLALEGRTAGLCRRQGKAHGCGYWRMRNAACYDRLKQFQSTHAVNYQNATPFARLQTTQNTPLPLTGRESTGDPGCSSSSMQSKRPPVNAQRGGEHERANSASVRQKKARPFLTELVLPKSGGGVLNGYGYVTVQSIDRSHIRDVISRSRARLRLRRSRHRDRLSRARRRFPVRRPVR